MAYIHGVGRKQLLKARARTAEDREATSAWMVKRKPVSPGR